MLHKIDKNKKVAPKVDKNISDRIFLKKNFVEKYQFRDTFFVFTNFV